MLFHLFVGEITEQELTAEFLSNFEHTEKKGEISYAVSLSFISSFRRCVIPSLSLIG